MRGSGGDSATLTACIASHSFVLSAADRCCFRHDIAAQLCADPRSALGPALNDQSYYVGRVERNRRSRRHHQHRVTEIATKPVVAKYTGVLAAADIEELTYTTTFMIMQSMRLDLGAGSQVHP